MRRLSIFSFAALVVAATASTLLAQVVDPDVKGPARRAASGAAEAAGAPGVERRIERREETRDAVRAAQGNPNAAARNQARAASPEDWRMRYHNRQWWYYTPQNRWKYYSNNTWTDYDANTYVAPGYNGSGYNDNYYYNRRGRRYSTGYRGVYGPPSTPYSNGTRAGNAGSNLGADIGAAANGAQGANTGAAIGGAIGNAIGEGGNAVRNVVP